MSSISLSVSSRLAGICFNTVTLVANLLGVLVAVWLGAAGRDPLNNELAVSLLRDVGAASAGA